MLKIKARLPVPQKKSAVFEKMLTDVGGKLAGRVQETYKELTGNWKQDGERPIDTPVVFKEKLTRKTGGLLVEVKTNSLKYRYVDLGTESHDITPRPDNPTGLLKFPQEFRPRTQPKVLKMRQGGKNWGGPWMTMTHVVHPGIKEPRNFEETINREQLLPTYKDLAAGYMKVILGLYKIKEE